MLVACNIFEGCITFSTKLINHSIAKQIVDKMVCIFVKSLKFLAIHFALKKNTFIITVSANCTNEKQHTNGLGF